MTNIDIDYSQEIWKKVVEFGDLYEVSNMGRLRSLDKIIPNKNGAMRPMKGRILKPSIDSKGYLYFKFRKPDEARNERKNYRVHRLVANAFLGPSDLPIDHINENRADNRDCNLQYCTIRENTAKCFSKKRNRPMSESHVNYNRHSRKWVFSMKAGTEHIQEVFQTKEKAAEYKRIFLIIYPEFKMKDIRTC